jgi:hypothetical protein
VALVSHFRTNWQQWDAVYSDSVFKMSGVLDKLFSGAKEKGALFMGSVNVVLPLDV